MTDYPIPLKVLDAHAAFIGKTGSGKTYAAKGAVEQLLDLKRRVCVVDPTGVWSGLRSSSSGKRAGYPVVIFGGRAGDLPLSGAAGETIAEVIGTSSTPAIIDTSQLRTGERTRFFTDFAETLMRKNEGPLHLVIDEAHLFAPQAARLSPQSGEMLHAANNLVSLGRSRGLRIILISQRASKLHKDTLTQVETLVALRVIAPQDRAAVRSWIEDNADAGKGQEIISSLATLKTGTAWVWSPEAQILDRVAFPKIRTLDTSAAPDAGGKSDYVLASIDVAAVEAKLVKVREDFTANDPSKLKAQLQALRSQLANVQAAAPAQSDLVAARAQGIDAGVADGIREAKAYFQPQIRAAAAWMDRAQALMDELPHLMGGGDAEWQAIVDKLTKAPKVPPTDYAAQRTAAIARGNGGVLLPPGVKASTKRGIQDSPRWKESSDDPLPIGEARILTAVLQSGGRVDRRALTTLTGYKRTSRDSYLQRLAQKGLIVGATAGWVEATTLANAALPDYRPLPTGSALKEYWMRQLPDGEGKVLDCVARYPEPIERAAVCERTGYRRSSCDSYLQRLAARQLVEFPQRGFVKPSAALFD